MRSGFTLIEILIVIAIIGILSSIVLTSSSESRSRAFDAQKMVNLRNLNTAIQIFMVENGVPPLVGPPPNSPINMIDLSVLWNNLGTALGINNMPHGRTYPNNFQYTDFFEYSATYNQTDKKQYGTFCIELGQYSYFINVTLEHLAKGGLTPGTNYFTMGGGTHVQVYSPVCP